MSAAACRGRWRWGEKPKSALMLSLVMDKCSYGGEASFRERRKLQKDRLVLERDKKRKKSRL